MNKQIETIESKPKLDLNKLKLKSSAKTPKGLILSYAKRFRSNGNIDKAVLFQEL